MTWEGFWRGPILWACRHNIYFTRTMRNQWGIHFARPHRRNTLRARVGGGGWCLSASEIKPLPERHASPHFLGFFYHYILFYKVPLSRLFTQTIEIYQREKEPYWPEWITHFKKKLSVLYVFVDFYLSEESMWRTLFLPSCAEIP